MMNLGRKSAIEGFLNKGFSVRQAVNSDCPAIEKLMVENDMVGAFDAESCFVIDSDDNGLAGFVRLEMVENRFYIRPIIVSTQYQGKAIGKCLVSHVLSVLSDITVVSRGSAEGFYRSFDFEPIEWEQVAQELCNECRNCPELNNCVPIPMRLIQSNSRRISSHEKAPV